MIRAKTIMVISTAETEKMPKIESLCSNHVSPPIRSSREISPLGVTSWNLILSAAFIPMSHLTWDLFFHLLGQFCEDLYLLVGDVLPQAAQDYQ